VAAAEGVEEANSVERTVTRRLDDWRMDNGRDVGAELDAVRKKIERALGILDEVRRRVEMCGGEYDWDRSDWLGVKIADLAIAADLFQRVAGTVMAAEAEAQEVSA
jgi:hypothetical protein